MPTEPYEPLLNRGISKVLPSGITEIAAPVLRETVNYATNVYRRCQTSEKGRVSSAFPVLASYLHMIQMADSVEVLILNGCSASCNLLVSSSFEAKLAILYLLEKNCERRSSAWLVKYIIDQIEDMKVFSAPDPKVHEFKKSIEKPDMNIIFGLKPLPDSTEAIRALNEILKKPQYAEANREYDKLLNKNIRNPPWFSFYGGPLNLRRLAQHLNQDKTYDILYPRWSRITPIRNSAQLKLLLENGTHVLGPIRDSFDLDRVAFQSLAILIETTFWILREYRAGEMASHWKWFESEIRQRLEGLGTMDFLKLQWLIEKIK